MVKTRIKKGTFAHKYGAFQSSLGAQKVKDLPAMRETKVRVILGHAVVDTTFLYSTLAFLHMCTASLALSEII